MSLQLITLLPPILNPTPLPIFPTPKEHIDAILDEQIISTRDGGVQRFLVRWRDHHTSDDTWITSDDLWQIDRDMFEYYQSRLASYSTKSSFLHPGRVGGDTGFRPTISRVYSRRSKKAYPVQSVVAAMAIGRLQRADTSQQRAAVATGAIGSGCRGNRQVAEANTSQQRAVVATDAVNSGCRGNRQVWRVNDQEKILLPASDQSKFYSGDCYIFQYSYPGEDKEEYLIGTWFGKQSVEEDRASATAQASKMVESLKFLPVQARIYEGNEPIQFFSIFQSFIVFKGGLSDGYKKHITESELPDATYTEDGLALFRVQGSGPENMQAIQLEPVASSLSSSYCCILYSGSTVFTWSGNLTTSEDQELVERQLDLIKPNMQSKTQKEGAESEQFWDLLGGKSEYPSQKIGKDAESDPHLFSCTFTKGDLKVTEIYTTSTRTI
ncbi:villin 4 [Actinidia rufa]|uniref:Villin 4 n=1 Tax=Actinidia rufa TaxID=165716 RepID=A0A7J0DDL2_9ERIC|nr:villin 4 [Actinidia rufa]